MCNKRMKDQVELVCQDQSVITFNGLRFPA